MFAKLDPEQRGNLALLLIGAFVFVTLFSINFLSQINLSQGTWKYPQIIPTMTPVGWDFRIGLYKPAKQILEHEPVFEVYPPFAYSIGLPFALTMPPDQGYRVQVVFLFLLNIGVILLSLTLASQFFDLCADPALKKPLFVGLFLCMLIFQFSSYGFTFSVERGNFDIYAIFFSLIGLWLLIKYPKTWVWQVICISIATHLKIYPAILFLLLFWKHRFKIMPSAILVNCLLLFIFGSQTAFSFIQSLQTFTSTTSHYWAGNHSSASFLFYFGIPEKSAGGIFLTLLPLVIWLTSVLLLLRDGYSERKALWAFMISVPVMCVVPTISNDYKLVILITVLSMLLYLLCMEFIQNGALRPLLLISATMVLFFYIGNSYALLQPVFQNKWPFIVSLQILLLLSLVHVRKNLDLIRMDSAVASAA
jgi:hypothetical protein